MTSCSLANVSIVLVGTKHPGNLGAVARAMANMGLSDLRLVRPDCAIDGESERRARAGIPVLCNARRFRTLRGALRGVRLVVGTTGKTGGYREPADSPRSIAPEILRAALLQRAALVFGPEDTGLVDDDLALCQRLARIPTGREAPSLNLAHAVAVFCYELRLESLNRPAASRLELAPLEQVEAMYRQLDEALHRIGFLHPKNARHMMFALRRFFGRAGLTRADVGMLRGIARQIAWYGDNPNRQAVVSNDRYASRAKD